MVRRGRSWKFDLVLVIDVASHLSSPHSLSMPRVAPVRWKGQSKTVRFLRLSWELRPTQVLVLCSHLLS